MPELDRSEFRILNRFKLGNLYGISLRVFILYFFQTMRQICQMEGNDLHLAVNAYESMALMNGMRTSRQFIPPMLFSD